MPRRKRRLASRIRDYVRGLLAFLFSNVGVIVLVVAYTIAGAFMFQAIEGDSEMERVNNMTRERDNTAQYLWQNVTLALNLFNETALREKLASKVYDQYVMPATYGTETWSLTVGVILLRAFDIESKMKEISIELQQYQKRVVVMVRQGWDGARYSRQWSFSSAFLYSLTVITTIGYGHLSPRTNWGKVTTILYALLGMPLFLLYLTNVGELLARWFKCIYALVCLCRGCPGFTRRRVARLRPQFEISDPESIERPPAWRSRYSDSDVMPEYRIPHMIERYPRGYNRRVEYGRSISMGEARGSPRAGGPGRPAGPGRAPAPGSREASGSSDFSYVTFDAQTITVPISVCVAIMVGYIMFGSMIFGMWEKWDQLDGAYFCFISLSSIGFGDFVPGERVYTARIETSFIVCSMYLMLGMALVAMCFNLMQEQVIHYFAGLKRALKRITRCKR